MNIQRLFFISSVLMANPVSAEMEAQEESRSIPDLEIHYHSPKFSRLDRSRAWLGERLNRTSERIDLFFAERFFGDEVLTGHLQADNKAKLFFEVGYLDNHNKTVSDVGIDLNFSLPNTEKHLKLVVSSNDNNNDNRINDQTLQRSISEEEDNGFFTGLQLVFDHTKKWLPSIELGMRWGSQPEVFIEAEIKRRWQYTKHKWEASQSVVHFSERKLISTTRVNYKQTINDAFLFQVFNQFRLFDEQDLRTISHTVNLVHKLSGRNALIYQVSVGGDNLVNNDLDTYTTSVKFRRRIHDSWLFIEAEPLYTHDVDQPEQTGSGFFLRLEMLLNE